MFDKYLKICSKKWSHKNNILIHIKKQHHELKTTAKKRSLHFAFILIVKVKIQTGNVREEGEECDTQQKSLQVFYLIWPHKVFSFLSFAAIVRY